MSQLLMNQFLMNRILNDSSDFNRNRLFDSKHGNDCTPISPVSNVGKAFHLERSPNGLRSTPTQLRSARWRIEIDLLRIGQIFLLRVRTPPVVDNFGFLAGDNKHHSSSRVFIRYITKLWSKRVRHKTIAATLDNLV
jgi:hypothetical protein